MNGHSPATKQCVRQYRSEVKSQLEQLRSALTHMHENLVKRISLLETRLFRAFSSFSDINNKRLVHGGCDSLGYQPYHNP
jgi:hypothetical protein